MGQYATRATTRKQLGLICGLGAHDRSILSILANPGVIHYAGHRISASGDGRFTPAGEAHVREAIDGALDAHHIGFGFGSLASGADILFAEALLARHAELHVVMPFGVDAFIEASVIDSGPVWVDRFHRCFAQAKTVVYASDGDYLGDAVMFDFCARVAMGEALGRAAALDAEVRQIVVWDGEVSDNVAGTAVDIATWRRTGRAATVISPRPDGGGPPFHDVEAPATSIAADDGADGETSPRAQASLSKERVTRAMLFADIAGFSKLTDRQIPTFIEQVMWPLARAIDAHGDGALLRQTWGDGLYLVFPSVSAAARCALALQATMRGVDLVGVGLSELRGMRIGVHVGPVYEGWDEVRKEINFFGANVTRAARIEPRTPEGEVYVTHPFASLIALEGEGHWTCQYVGHVPAAKDYGVLPMYVLKEPAMGRTD